MQDQELFNKAYALATKVHKLQTRDEGTPYITHIDAILNLLRTELNLDDDALFCVAALHDVLEDSDIVTFEALEKEFGYTIAHEVKLLTKKKGQTIESYLHDITTYEFSTRTVNVKLCDRLHNVRSLQSILTSRPDKARTYITETETYYLPIALQHNLLYDQLISELTQLKQLLSVTKTS